MKTLEELKSDFEPGKILSKELLADLKAIKDEIEEEFEVLKTVPGPTGATGAKGPTGYTGPKGYCYCYSCCNGCG